MWLNNKKKQFAQFQNWFVITPLLSLSLPSGLGLSLRQEFLNKDVFLSASVEALPLPPLGKMRSFDLFGSNVFIGKSYFLMTEQSLDLSLGAGVKYLDFKADISGIKTYQDNVGSSIAQTAELLGWNIGICIKADFWVFQNGGQQFGVGAGAYLPVFSKAKLLISGSENGAYDTTMQNDPALDRILNLPFPIIALFEWKISF